MSKVQYRKHWKMFLCMIKRVWFAVWFIGWLNEFINCVWLLLLLGGHFSFQISLLNELFLGMFLSSKIKYMKMLGRLSPPFLHRYFSYYGFTNCRKIHLGCNTLVLCSLLEHQKISLYYNTCYDPCYNFQNSDKELETLFLN